MRNGSGTNKPGHITTGDIFDDLGFSHAETLEAKIKSDILHAIVEHSELHNFSQAKLARMLNAHQPDVSNLLRGKISKFSITRLIQFASRLDLDARIEVKPSRPRRVCLEASSAKPRKPLRKARLAAV